MSRMNTQIKKVMTNGPRKVLRTYQYNLFIDNNDVVEYDTKLLYFTGKQSKKVLSGGGLERWWGDLGVYGSSGAHDVFQLIDIVVPHTDRLFPVVGINKVGHDE